MANMQNVISALIVLVSGWTIFLLFYGIEKYFGYKLRAKINSFFNSPTYIAYKQKHDEGEKENRLANRKYSYNEKYIDYRYEKYSLFDRENIKFNHHNMPSFYVGAFEGTAECTPNDSKNGNYMASIYDGQHIFINKIEIEQRVFDYIIHCGGCVRAYGNIEEYDENYVNNRVYVGNRWWDNNEPKYRIYYGDVFIECKKNVASTTEENNAKIAFV